MTQRRMLLILAALIFGAVFFRFEEYVVRNNYTVLGYVPCDSATEQCFVSDCEEGDEDCDLTPYKKVEVKANIAPRCLFENDCESFSCDGVSNCRMITCSDDVLAEGETCATHPSLEDTANEMKTDTDLNADTETP